MNTPIKDKWDELVAYGTLLGKSPFSDGDRVLFFAGAAACYYALVNPVAKRSITAMGEALSAVTAELAALHDEAETYYKKVVQ